MCNQTQARHPAATVADYAIEQVRYGVSYSRWLAALAGAICDQLEGEEVSEASVSRAKDLAGLAQYLADDLTQYTDMRIKELQSELDEAEAQEVQ